MRPPCDPTLRGDGRALELLYDVASAALQSHSIDEAIQRSLARICQRDPWLIGHAFTENPLDRTQLRPSAAYYGEFAERFGDLQKMTAALHPISAQDLPGRVLASGTPVWINDINPLTLQFRAGLARELGMQTVVAFPILIEDQPVGVIELFSDQHLEMSDQMLAMFSRIGIQLGQLAERLSFEKQLADATEGKQQWIAGELHENVAQQLAGIGMLAEELRQKLNDHDPSLEHRAARLVKYVHETQSQVRSLSHGLMPVTLDAHGLRVALNRLAIITQEVSGIRCTFEFAEQVECDAGAASYLYRIAQEAVQNAIDHAHAGHIRIRLESNPADVGLSISDDGIGMDVQAHRAGMGIRTMRHLTGLIRARLNIESLANKGTTVQCMHAQHADGFIS